MNYKQNQLGTALELAIGIIKDLLMQDDAQAYKEARGWLPNLERILNAHKGTDMKLKDSKSFDDPIEAEDYVKYILGMYPQKQYNTRIEIWNYDKDASGKRVYTIQWEISHGE